MQGNTDRRAFLTGIFRPDPPAAVPLRPFGAADEVGFLRDCTGCGDCVTACPQRIIVMDAGDLPMLDPVRGGCSFCGQCIEACPTPALESGRDWPWRAIVKDSCLAMNAVTCRMCQDMCEQSAIRFRLATGGRSAPVIDHDLCTGCANCVGFCPSSSLQLVPFQERTEA